MKNVESLNCAHNSGHVVVKNASILNDNYIK